jgi:MrcB-like, N-terminal domain
MDLQAALAGVATLEYAPGKVRRQPAQQHLHQVRRELPALLPAGLSVLVSGSGQSLPYVPWIAVLNPDVTHTAQEGLYVVYLYRSDLSQVSLTMNQGATQHRRRAEQRGMSGRAAEKQAVAELLHESRLFRRHLSSAALDGLLGPDAIDLGKPNRFYPEAYEAGTIAGKLYRLSELPAEGVLRSDLRRFLALYDSCVELNDELRATDPEAIHTTAGAASTRRPVRPKPPIFRPKSAAEYTATVQGQQQTRERRHEGGCPARRGTSAAVQHLIRRHPPWLV